MDSNTENGAVSSSQTETPRSLPAEKRTKFEKKQPSTSKFCITWLSKPEFKNWLQKSNFVNRDGDEFGFCKVCRSNITAHKSCITRHGESAKHKFNLEQVNENKKISQMYQRTTPLEENLKIAEIKLCGILATNNLPFLLMDTLCPLLSNIFPDSQIAKNLSVKRTKATAIINESLGEVFLHNLYDKLRKPGCFFSLVMDETTDIAVKKQCAFTVIYLESEQIITRFFDFIEMDAGKAEDLYKALKETIMQKNIPFSNLVGFSSDTTNVMVGEHNSVFSLLKKDNPNIVCIKCSCHMVHLAASKACLKLPRSVEDLLRNLGSHFNRSSLRRHKFKEFQIFFQTEIHKILSPATTRWLSLKQCVDRVLEQYDPIKAYLREVVFEDPSVTTEQMLNAMENKFTQLYLEFMSYTLGLLTDFNVLFQSEKPLLYKLKPETEKLLRILCSNYIDISSIRQENIFTLNHKDSRKFVPLEKIYLGVHATETFETLKQDPNVNKSDINTFLKSCLEFYIELTSNLKQRFEFEDPLYDLLTIIDPVKAQSFETKSLKGILNRFPVLNVNVQDLDNEWRQHALLEHDKLCLSKNAEEYWPEIFKLKNAAGNELFPNLRKAVFFLFLLPFSNASVERVFSDLFNVKTDKRNLLSSSTIRALLAAKEGIEREGGCVKFHPSKDMLAAKIWLRKNL